MKNGNPSKFVASHVVGLPKSGIREFFAIAANMEDVVSLGIGEPDFVTPWQSLTLGEYETKHGSWYIILSPGFIIALRTQSRTSETPTPTSISHDGSYEAL